MTNEELAEKIRDGHGEYLCKLWENIRRFVELRAKDYNRPNDTEDIIQEAFLQLQEAAENYSPEAGKSFIGYYARYYLPRAARIAIYGGRGSKWDNEPLNNHTSLDAPIGEDEEAHIMDSLFDLESEAAYRHIEDLSFWGNVGRIINRGIESISSPEVREVVLYHYHHNKTLRDGSIALCTEYRTHVARWKSGLKSLRRFLMSLSREEKERSGLDVYIQSHVYYAGSVSRFKDHLFTSTVEEIALKNAEIEERTKRLNELLAMLSPT